MVERVLLAWERCHDLNEEDGHDNNGYVSVERDGKVIIKNEFKGTPYHQMIKRFAEMARSKPNAELHFVRLDQKPTPIAMQMQPDMARLLREDPVAYIRATSPPPQRIVLRKETKVAVKDTVAIKLRPIRAGHDTIADAFGEAVYLRMQRGGAVECPRCGRWGQGRHGARDGDGNLIQPKNHGLFTCDKCGLSMVGKAIPKEDGGWWAVHTEVLLTDGRSDRYYLPRAWNTSGSWISHEDLKNKYENYLKEKQECSTKHTAPSG